MQGRNLRGERVSCGKHLQSGDAGGVLASGQRSVLTPERQAFRVQSITALSSKKAGASDRTATATDGIGGFVVQSAAESVYKPVG